MEVAVISKDEIREYIRQAAMLAAEQARETVKTPEIMTKAECAEYLRCDTTSLNRYMKCGLVCEYRGDTPVFRKTTVDLWLQRKIKSSENNSAR